MNSLSETLKPIKIDNNKKDISIVSSIDNNVYNKNT